MSPIQDQAKSSQRILVADDDSGIRELIALSLIRSGYEVDTARDGAEAWKALNEVSYYLLITDYKMPKMTGLELIQLLRSKEMALPVILVSGTIPAEELRRQPWLHVDATLSKPFDVEELLDVVKNILSSLAETSLVDLMLSRHKLEAALMNVTPAEAQAPAGAQIQNKGNPSHHILVVDDNNETRQLSINLLAGSGYQVEGVKDGADGWEALQADDYDLVLTDNMMPRMTGVEMIAKLYAARLTIPIIMATGHLPTHEFASKPWLTPDATLQRPFSNDDLLATVKKVLRTDEGNKLHMEMLLPKYL